LAAEQSAAKHAFEAAQHAMAQIGRRSRKKAAVPVEDAASNAADSKTPVDDAAQTA